MLAIHSNLIVIEKTQTWALVPPRAYFSLPLFLKYNLSKCQHKVFSKVSPSIWVPNCNPSQPLKLLKSAKSTAQLHHLGAASLGISKCIEEKSSTWCWAYPTWFFPGFKPVQTLHLHYLGSSPMPSHSYMCFILCSFFFFSFPSRNDCFKATDYAIPPK